MSEGNQIFKTIGVFLKLCVPFIYFLFLKIFLPSISHSRAPKKDCVANRIWCVTLLQVFKNSLEVDSCVVAIEEARSSYV